MREVPQQSRRRASDAGRELARLGASKGGHARARALSPAERSEIARRAVRARWARFTASTRATDGDQPAGDHQDEVPRSLFQGRVSLTPVDVDCHVLSDGSRSMSRSDLLRALFDGRSLEDSVRQLRRIATVDDTVLVERAILFARPDGATVIVGYRLEVLVQLCESILCARDAALVKKKQSGLATRAEAIVRVCARNGLESLVDEASGYDRIRAGRFWQLGFQATIADEMHDWVGIVPDQFWEQLARLEGSQLVPGHPPIEWVSYAMAFVWDAVEPDVGRELRRAGRGPKFGPDHRRWVLDTGAKRLDSTMRRVIPAMTGCADIHEFRSTFAKVLLKRPVHLRSLEDVF